MNKKSIKFIVLPISILLLAVLFLFFFVNQNSKKTLDNNSPTISRLSASFAINVDDPREVVGSADYYFVAKINELTGNEYRDFVTLETEFGSKDVGDPYTNYSIEVIKNIKGDLILNTPISITKSGGISQDGKTIILFENDCLPEVGKTYVISAYAQEDGSLLIVGPNSNTEIISKMRSGILTDADFSVYENIYTNETHIERERFVANNDVGNKE